MKLIHTVETWVSTGTYRTYHTTLYLLQEHPLLAWPLFIFLLILAFYLYPEDYTCIHMHYLFWLVILSPYLFWLYSFWSLSCSPVLYLLAGSLARPLCAFHFTGTHPVISWAPYLTIGPWHCHPIPLLHPQLVTQSPVTFTIVSVCDSISPLPLPYHWSLTHSPSLTSFCTTTYSMVCARFPRL